MELEVLAFIHNSFGFLSFLHVGQEDLVIGGGVLRPVKLFLSILLFNNIQSLSSQVLCHLEGVLYWVGFGNSSDFEGSFYLGMWISPGDLPVSPVNIGVMFA